MSPYNPDIHHRHSIRLKDYDYASEGLYFVTICTQNRECLFGEIKNDEMILNDAGRMVEKWYHKTHDKFPDIICHEMVIMPNHFHCIWENVGLHGASAVGADPRVRPVTNDVRPVTNDVRPVTNNDRPIENIVRHIEPNNKHIVDNDNRVVDEDAHANKGGDAGHIKGAHVGMQNNIDKYHEDEGGHAGMQNNIDKYHEDEGGHVGMQNNIDKYHEDEGGHVGPPLRVNDILNDSNLVENTTGSPLSSVVQWFKTMSTNEYIRGVKQLGWTPFDRKLWQRNYYEHIIRDDVSLHTIAYYIISNPAQWQEDKFYQPSKTI